MKQVSKYKYIYNLEQCLFFINNNCKIDDIKPHPVTKNVYMKFINNENLKIAFKKWKQKLNKNI